MVDGNGGMLPIAGRDPGSRAPAPGSLRLVQALVNTLSVQSGQDLLGTTPDASQSLAEAGLLPAGFALAGAQRQALVEVREAIRGVLRAHTAGLPDPEAASRLSMALAPGRLALAVDPDGGARLVSADHEPISRAIGRIAISIAEAASAGTWARLKSCPGLQCGWAFYDRSPSGKSQWCSMQVCGSRAKMRAYRGRLAQSADAPGRHAY